MRYSGLLRHESAVESGETYGNLVGDVHDRSHPVIDAAIGEPVTGRNSSALTAESSWPGHLPGE